MMKVLLKGPTEASSGLPRTTWWDPLAHSRLVAFGLAVALVAFLVARIDANIWRDQARLQEGFTAIKAEKFYFGVNFRVNLRKLSTTFLDFQLTAQPADLENYRREARELENWLQAKEKSFVAPAEREAFANLRAAFTLFLARAEGLLRTGGSSAGPRESFAAIYEQLRQDYRPVLAACDDVVQAEHGAFDVFLVDSEHALLRLQRLFELSLLLMMTFAITLAVLVYRGMFAPLRARLSESQALLERQEKLAALGALGAGVAHEIRNPLTAIKFRLFSLLESLPPKFADNEDARVISEELTRLNHIVRDFLQFARPSEPELVRLPAQRVLAEVRELMKSELESAGIDLRLEVQQPSWIRADTHQLKQVLINLIQNSAESIEHHGSITLKLKGDTVSLRGKNRAVAVLGVSDTGKGIPPEVQKRLFDPFFTTKEGGTGLGLAIGARIIEKHGGVLRYETQMNRGTTFEILLPRLEDDVSENSAH